MAKNNAVQEDAGDVEFKMDTPATEPTELEKVTAEKDVLTNRLERLERAMERAEFAGADKNRQRIWDEQNDADENVKLASLPSFDGKDPIIKMSTVAGSRVYINANNQPVDNQSWHVLTKGGREEKVAVEEVSSLLSGNGIAVRINDWLKFREKTNQIARLKHQYQKSNKSMPASQLKELREDIESKERALTVNVTLSEDLGKTFLGETFDALASLLNAHR